MSYCTIVMLMFSVAEVCRRPFGKDEDPVMMQPDVTQVKKTPKIS